MPTPPTRNEIVAVLDYLARQAGQDRVYFTGMPGGPDFQFDTTRNQFSMPTDAEIKAQYTQIIFTETQTVARRQVTDAAAAARAAITGSTDPAKLAEYVDKALTAPDIIAGTADPATTAAARTEALDLGMADKKNSSGTVTKTAEVALAEIWLAKAAALRSARNDINRLERGALRDISTSATDAAVDTVVITAKAAIDAVVAQLAGA